MASKFAMRPFLFLFSGFLALVCLCFTSSSHADDEISSFSSRATGEENGDNRLASLSRSISRSQPRYDYSRFSNGPRWVPRPRGASLKRAQALGLGTRDAARALLRSTARDEVLEAAGDEKPRTLLWPVVNGRWGRGFGYVRKHRKNLRHNGVDIVAPEGTAVRAAAAGIVAYSDNGVKGFGNVVIIVHPNGWTTLYAHNLRNTVQAGWRVKRGERIALVGQTGIARGPHLHFELRDHGRLRNPKRFFTGVKSSELNGPLIDLDPIDEESTGKPVEGDLSREDDPTREEPGQILTDKSEQGNTERGRSTGDGARPSFEVGTRSAALKFIQTKPALGECEQVDGPFYSNLLWPVRGGKISRAFHPRRHRGVDIAAEEGAAVRAAADGLVVYSGDELRGYGNAIILLHRNGWVTVYGSNRDNAVKAGDQVKRGEWIAHVGATASGGEPHLHFELLENGKRRDPSRLFVNVPAP